MKRGRKIICGISLTKVRVHRVTGGVIDNEQGGLRVGKRCVDQIFILKQIGEKAREKKRSVCGFYRFGECIR